MAVHHRSCSPRVLKAAAAFMAIGIAAYIVGPPLYWHFAEGLAASSSSSSCGACVCDCTSQPILALPDGLSNLSFAGNLITIKSVVGYDASAIPMSLKDCGKHDREVSEEIEKSFTDLLTEELKLREAETLESKRRADMVLLEAKKMASQYQKEADKCNSGMETCEEAREKAEAALQGQKRLSEMWEMRARQKGWNDGNRDSAL